MLNISASVCFFIFVPFFLYIAVLISKVHCKAYLLLGTLITFNLMRNSVLHNELLQGRHPVS